MSETGLGERMKARYEDRWRFMLPRRTYTIVRVDGKNFSSWTRGLKKPFDARMGASMRLAAEATRSQMQGCKMCYLQSDEASFLLTDFSQPETEAWFDGNLQKIASVTASLFTAAFGFRSHEIVSAPAIFDARAFVIPDPVEVENYLIWRQRDARRNAIQATARAIFSHKKLQNVNGEGMRAMIGEAGQMDVLQQPHFYLGTVILVREDGGHDIRSAPDFVSERQILEAQVPRQWAETVPA